MLELAIATVLAPAAVSWVIVDVSIVDPAANAVTAHQNVAFSGDRITYIGTNLPAAEAKRIDGKGKYLIPGLWDMHVHWYDKPTLGLFTANGVTGIREMFGMRELLAWRDAIEKGTMTGPRMVVGSPIVDGPKPFWQGSLAAGTETAGRAAVRQVKKAGYDFVKVYSFLPPPAYFGIMDEAKKLGFPADGHIPTRVSIGQAIAAGQRCAEHLYGFAIAAARRENEFRRAVEKSAPKGPRGLMDAQWDMEEAIAASLDLEKEQALFKQLKDASMFQCPTLVVLHAMANFFDPAFRANHPHNAYIFKSAKEGFWKPQPSPNLKRHLELERKAYERNFELFKRMQKAGVPIVAGTDVLNPYTFPGFSLHDELQLFVKGGMTPAVALCTATVNPARMLKKQNMGSIKVGNVADLVLLDANPLTDIGNTTKIASVVQRGRVYTRRDVEAIKARARTYFKKN
jgi:imidazolonepropionase-like amidohydrolase